MMTEEQLKAIRSRVRWFENDGPFGKGMLQSHACEDMPILLAEVERLREALGFYANENNYDTPSDYGIGLYCEVTDDNGGRARKALKGGDH